MLKSLFILIFLINMLFIFSFHPLGMIFTLIGQTILLSVLIFLLSYFPWFSYTLILVFLGGMLVLFTYMANIASNEKFSPKISLIYSLPLLLALSVILPAMALPSNKGSTPYTEESYLGFNVMKIYEDSLLPMIILMAAMILLTLLAVVKLSKANMGPIRID